MKKIILISANPVEGISENQFKKEGYDEWTVRVSREILKRTHEYSIECWNPDNRIKNIKSTTIKGITFKRFPSFGTPYRFGFRSLSFKMLRQLKTESKNHKILVHFHTYSSYIAYQMLTACKDIPVVAQHHGSTHPLLLLKRQPKFFLALPLLLIEELVERILFKRVDHFFVLSNQEKKDLSRFIEKDKIEIQPMAVDFDNFKPIDKINARKKLGIPLNKKIIFFIGRYLDAKGVDKIIDAANILKKEDKNIFLMLAGGSKEDTYYETAKKEADLELGKIDRNMLQACLSASDVYVMHCNETVKKYGGMGVAPMEALSCNVPIVSTNLIHAFAEKEKMGKIPRNDAELTPHLKYVLNHKKEYKNCREVAKKYFDWNPIINNTMKVYEELFKNKY